MKRADVRQPPAVAPRLSVRPLSLALALAWASGNAAPPVNELPTGAQVRAGSVSISQTAATMTVQQASQRAVVDWNTFNVGSQAQVNFVQPNASAAILNRVLDSRPSEIFGRITSNGQVFLTNASGIYFGPNSSVDVGALVASTHGIANQDFMDGRLRLERNGSTGSVINAGRLNALVQEELGGYIALLAPEVRNEGVIIAKLGTVALAAGEAITLDIAGSRTLASLTVTPSQIRALVENRNLVQAPGGLIVLSAQAASSLQGGVVSNSGRLEATGLAMRGGRIVLEASDRIENTGVIDASASASGPAGAISLNAPLVANSGQIKVDATEAGQAAGSVDILARQFIQGVSGSISAAALAAMGAGRGGRVGISASEGVELAGVVRVTAGEGATPAPDTDSTLSANADGGDISILAGTSLRLDSVLLDAAGANRGGHILIEGERRTPTPETPRPNPLGLLFTGSTLVRTSGRRGSGGAIEILGDWIQLLANTRLEATGRDGGVIRVGGDWQGGNDVRQAIGVHMARDVVIDVSAAVGAGGTAVLWSDVHNPYSVTSAYGTILASGGSESGDGGRIETSGRYLHTAGIRVHASAPHGAAGLWLLDPGNITIDAVGPASGDVFAPLFDATQDSVILVADIEAALNGGVPVSITNTAGGGGNITVTSSITKSAGLPAMLSLRADGGQINLNNVTISATGGNTLNLELLANTYSFTTSTLDLGPGAMLTFGPSGVAFAGPFDWQGSLAGLTINNMATLGGLMIGSPTNTADITISSAINIAGQIMLQGGNITINQPLTSPSLTALTATGTISGAGTITTADLLIDNAGSVNGLSTAISANLAVNSAGGVSLSNTGNLVIGSIFATNGITAGGTINIATTTGNINISQPVVTSDATGNAIRLNAGQTAGPGGLGTPASGNIDITGAAVAGPLQAGTGGIISLFSGSIAGSANLITKVGGPGSGNFRYNSDEGFSGYTAPLSLSTGAPNSGLNAIFREQPSLTVTPSLATIVYGDANPAFTPTLAGAVNGDNAVATTAGLPNWIVAGPNSTSGRPTAGLHDVLYDPGPMTNSLGYALIDNVGSTNELTVNQKPIFATGITATNKVYDATIAAALVTGGAAVTGGAVNSIDNLFYTGDVVTVNAGGATGAFGTKDAGIAKPVAVAGLALAGADGGNYIVVDNSGATADITPKPLNVSGLTSANKVYDASLAATVGGAATLAAGQAPGAGSAIDGNPYTGDTVNVVGPATGTFDTQNVLTATTVSFAGLTLGGAEAGNYSLNPHATAAHTITPAPLLVTAVGVTKVVDGVPYAGGNGVSFANFVGGETVAVLGGVLSYAGTSQGATAIGNYLITPLGYTSTNYAVSFADGTLSITTAVAPPPAPPPVVLTPTPIVTTVPTLTTTPTPATDFTGTSTTPSTSTSTSTASAGGTGSSTDPLGGGTPSTASTTDTTSTSTSATGGTESSSDTASATSTASTTDGTGSGATGTTASSPSTTTTTASGGTTTPTQTTIATVSATPPQTQPAPTTPPAGATTVAPIATGGTVRVAGGTTGSIPAASGVPTAQAKTGSTTLPVGVTTTLDPVTAKPPAAIVTATTTRLASIEAPARSIDALVAARVEAAVGRGGNPATATRAGTAFSTALAQKLAQGQPMEQAMASAERVFQAESSLPPPRTPEVALSRAIAAGGGDVATTLNSVAPSKPGAGSAAFDRSLSAALARGVPMDVAVGAAKVAARQSEQAAIADTTPRAQLASGTAASASPQSASPAFQKSLGSMLAQGVSPQAAMARAGQAAEADAAAARADARNPSVGLALGRADAVISGPPGGASEQVLALALARGEASGPAMARAVEIQRAEQAAIAADARQPQASLVRGGATNLPERGADFDRALSNALSRGLSPEVALQTANRAADAVAPAPTPASALATGVGIERLVAPTGSSRTYRAALSTALARGLPVARAIETARRAEEANAFRFKMPDSVTRSLPRNLNGAQATDAAGRPLPSWLRFDPAARQFIATEVPEGGLPMQAVLVVGQARVPIVISDGPMPPAQRP
ncbi:MAG: filamentous hemagglutinin N-terminal domain-containing protein [Rhodocyclales bacterium]|nr:filamentous hemagglutinin N-terminal domain-containing protein [Rhodocyclales bacterium]